MWLASVPLWLLAFFAFGMGCIAAKRLGDERLSDHHFMYLAFFFGCWVASSAFGAAAVWVVRS